MNSLYMYFTDVIYRGPTIASMLMCVSASLIGAIVYLRKQSLLGEALSHATYPGLILGVGAFALLATISNDVLLSTFILGGAFLSSLFGLWLIQKLISKFKISSDAALCFILSAFFGIGLTLASQMQFTHSSLYRKAQTYLYGQAATMTDIHIMLYGILTAIVIIVIGIFYKELQTITFDKAYGQTIGMPTQTVDALFYLLTTAAIVIGIRSVGIVMVSAMLIAPAVAARQYTRSLFSFLVLSAIFGMLSGFLGNYLSSEISQYVNAEQSKLRFALPTGPMIVLVATFFALGSILFSVEKGVLARLYRMLHFQNRCMKENILKSLWRLGPGAVMSFGDITKKHSNSRFLVRVGVHQLIAAGLIKKVSKNSYKLTEKGEKKSAQIIRLHRLWEVYLVNYLGMGAERVHHSAEEMEHILTPELEKELTALLQDPQVDPHQQAIPGNI